MKRRRIAVEDKKVTILINQRPVHFQKSTLSPDDFRAAINAPSDYEVWFVVKDADPEGQLPVDDIQITGPVEISSGQRYRVVPPGTFGVQTMAPVQLVQEVGDLKKEGYAIELVEAEGWSCVIVRDYPVPPGYSKSHTDLLVKCPMSYPDGRPDMFWTDEDLKLADGRAPRSADTIEAALGRRWRRFSYHPQNWNPGVDNLRTYLEFISTGLVKATR